MARKMKDSGIEWIGEIPEDWKVIPLKNICKEFYSGGTPTASNNSYYTTTEFGYPFINISDLTNNKYVEIVGKHITIEAAKSKNLKLIDNNYVLLAMYASTGTVSMLKLRSYISQAILAIKPGIKIEKEYLFYFLSSFKPYSEVYSRGTTQNNLNAEIIKNLKVPIPNIKKQLKITNFLNKKSNQIQKLMNKINKQIQTLEDYKKSVITEAVTKGLDKNVEMKDSGIEWIGEISKHWELVKLKHIAEKISKGISPKYVEQQITPVVNQATFSNGVFNYDLKYCSDKPIGEGLLKKDDVLLATTGGGVLGKTYLFEEEGNYLASTDVAYLRFKNKNLSKLVYYILSVNYELLNGVYGKGSTNQTHLQMNMLSNMEIPITDLEELNQIIQAIDEKCSYIDEAITAKQKQLETLEEYKKSLIYEYVTGKKEVENVGTI